VVDPDDDGEYEPNCIEYEIDRDFDEKAKDALVSCYRLWDDASDRLSKVEIHLIA
jgi:hypothetical protein